jgi:anti-sigma factor RsiW
MALSFFRHLMRWRHPNDSRLLAFHDGELSGERRARIQAHLNLCPRCLERAAQITQDWKDFAESISATAEKPPFEKGKLIDKIQASVHAWSAANLPASPEQEFVQTETGRQVTAMLAIYLGQRAAKALIDGIEASEFSRQEKLAQAASTLRVLLGHKSAAAVVEKLVGIMGPLSESAGKPSAS